MPKPSRGPRLGGSPAHERIILANLASQLFEHGRITTTVHRAKRLQPLAEKLISKAKRGDLHSRRLVYKTIGDRSVVHHLFTSIAPKLVDRDGGCTRITKIGPRQGDNAPMAVIEVVLESVEETREAKKKAKEQASRKARAAQSTRKSSGAAKATPAAASTERAASAEASPAEVASAESVASAASAGSPASAASPDDVASAQSAESADSVADEVTGDAAADAVAEERDSGESPDRA